MKTLLGLALLILGGVALSFIGYGAIWLTTVWWPEWLWQVFALAILGVLAFVLIEPVVRRSLS